MKFDIEMIWIEITDYWLDNGIGAEGAKWISEALKVNKSITHIGIGGMKFSNEINEKK